MSKDIKLKQINTIVSDDYISKINEIFDNVRITTFEVKINKYKKLEFKNNIVVILQVEDKTGEISVLLNGSRYDEKFTKVVNEIAIDRHYRISGSVVFIDGSMYEELNNICYNKINIKDYIIGNKLMAINGIQNIDKTYYDYEKIKIFGVDINTLNDLDLEDTYEFVNKNTDYLKGISYNEVKEIAFTSSKDIAILLDNGLLLFNGKEKLNNINTLGFKNNSFMFAFSNDNIINCLTTNDLTMKSINNNDYKYKKIIITGLGISALTYENTIKFYGTLIDSVIDYQKFNVVEDIGYVLEDDEIVIIKNNEIISLFKCKKYKDKDVILSGKSTDYMILENNSNINND